MFLYDLGYSSFPVLVGFLFAIAMIRRFLKFNLINQLKWVAYFASLFVSAILVGPIVEPKRVGVSIMVGFFVTTSFALIVKKIIMRKKNISEIKD
jgi:hypothetical protein